MNRKILLSSISSDSHTWNLIFMQKFLEERSFEVKNIGNCVTTDLLFSEVECFEPGMVVLSTINGHGYLEAGGIINELRPLKSLKGFQLMLGGKICTEKTMESQYRTELLESGFDAVYTDSNSLLEFDRDLQSYSMDYSPALQEYC